MRDIYNRDPQDPNYVPYILEVTDPVEICVGQLKMMLLTDKGEVLGDPKFGLGLEALLFELNLSEGSVRKEIDLHLNTYCPLFRVLGGSYDLRFYLGTNRDIAFLDFLLPYEGDQSPVVSLKLS
jgi:hypothetical protein